MKVTDSDVRESAPPSDSNMMKAAEKEETAMSGRESGNCVKENL